LSYRDALFLLRRCSDVSSSRPESAIDTHAQEALLGIISLQFARTSVNTDEVLASWDAATVAHAKRATWLDWLVFKPLYVCVLLVGTWGAKAAFAFRGWNWERLAKWVGVAIVAAGICDFIENFFLMCMIDSRSSGESLAGSACPASSTFFASVKLVSLLLGAVYVVTGLYCWVYGRNPTSIRPR
jgi:hypothetical protein